MSLTTERTLPRFRKRRRKWMLFNRTSGRIRSRNHARRQSAIGDPTNITSECTAGDVRVDHNTITRLNCHVRPSGPHSRPLCRSIAGGTGGSARGFSGVLSPADGFRPHRHDVPRRSGNRTGDRPRPFDRVFCFANTKWLAKDISRLGSRTRMQTSSSKLSQIIR